MHRSRIAIIVAMVSLTLGCALLWNAANRGYLQEDVLALLEENGIHDATVTSCRMLGSTRAGG